MDLKLLEKINEDLSGLALKDKIDYFNKHIHKYNIVIGAYLLEENFYAYCIATFKANGKFISEKDMIRTQIVHLQKIVKRINEEKANQFEEGRIRTYETNLAYLKSLSLEIHEKEVITEKLEKEKREKGEWEQRIDNLKPIWQNILEEVSKCKSYKEKLLLWDKYELFEITKYFEDKLQFAISDTEDYKGDTFSIRPKDNEETLIYNSWFLDNFHKYYPQDSIEGLKVNFEVRLKNIKSSQGKIEMIKTEIESIERRVKTNESRHALVRNFSNGYNLTANGVSDKYLRSFYPDGNGDHDIHEFYKGVHWFWYKDFLFETLNNLQNPSTISIQNPSMEPRFKLTWNGDSNTLIHLFKQLKVKPSPKGNETLISNSYEDIAQFLKDNFTCFNSTDLATILRQIQNNKLNPKRNPLKLDELIED